MTDKKRFKLITNKEKNENNYERQYHTDPLKAQGASLKEEFMRFANEESGKRFTVEDLLRWC